MMPKKNPSDVNGLNSNSNTAFGKGKLLMSDNTKPLVLSIVVFISDIN